MDNLIALFANFHEARQKKPKFDLQVTLITLLIALVVIGWVCEIAIPYGF